MQGRIFGVVEQHVQVYWMGRGVCKCVGGGGGCAGWRESGPCTPDPPSLPPDTYTLGP